MTRRAPPASPRGVLSRSANASSSGERVSSLLPLPHTVVVPGDRFREVYYWRAPADARTPLSRHPAGPGPRLPCARSPAAGAPTPIDLRARTPRRDTYWVVEGLVASGLVSVAQGVVRNLLFLLDGHGFVPNGSRVYYLNRSQPPLLAPMACALGRWPLHLGAARDAPQCTPVQQ